MRKFITATIAVLLAAACSKPVQNAALDMLHKGDRAGALSVLEAARAKKPDEVQTHFLLFVLYQYQASQGEPARHDAYITSSLSEYDWITKKEGVTRDYRDMEGTLKASEKTRSAYEMAYAAVYGR